MTRTSWPIIEPSNVQFYMTIKIIRLQILPILHQHIQWLAIQLLLTLQQVESHLKEDTRQKQRQSLRQKYASLACQV